VKIRINVLVLTVFFISLFTYPTTSVALAPFEIPKLESFTPSVSSIDLARSENKINFELVVSHPEGISSERVNLWFERKDTKFKTFTVLNRTNSTIISGRNNVYFKGALEIPSFFESGLYDFYAESIEAYPANNSRVPKTQFLYPPDFSKFPNGLNSIQVRVNGELNLPNKTFVGPSYESAAYIFDDKPLTLHTAQPIFKVGEIYNPKDYFESRVSNLEIKVQALTLNICKVTDNKLMFIKVGTCEYKIYTTKNNDYLETSISLTSEILTARPKPYISIPEIVNDKATNLPKVIEIGKATKENGEIVTPLSITPSICMSTGQYWIKIFSGGTCKLQYKTEANTSYLDSDTYTVSFEITRDAQTISFVLPNTLNVSPNSLPLLATASSGQSITFSTTSTGVCSITGSNLNLLKSGNCSVTATQAGTSTLAPVSATATTMIVGVAQSTKKTITCTKGKTTKKVTGTNPKCPAGYKLKK
jgi:hypothetical protein